MFSTFKYIKCWPTTRKHSTAYQVVSFYIDQTNANSGVSEFNMIHIHQPLNERNYSQLRQTLTVKFVKQLNQWFRIIKQVIILFNKFDSFQNVSHNKNSIEIKFGWWQCTSQWIIRRFDIGDIWTRFRVAPNRSTANYDKWFDLLGLIRCEYEPWLGRRYQWQWTSSSWKLFFGPRHRGKQTP